jgi:hypothetical protein
VAGAENAGLAMQLIEDTADKYGIARDTLTPHSDRGSRMRAEGAAELLADPGDDILQVIQTALHGAAVNENRT